MGQDRAAYVPVVKGGQTIGLGRESAEAGVT